jgi:phosphate/sulfate permease
MEQLQAERAAGADEETARKTSDDTPSQDPKGQTVVAADNAESEREGLNISGPRPEGSNFSPKVLFWLIKHYFFRGVEQDIVSMQKKRNLLTGDLEMVHAHAEHFENRAEYMFSFLQVLTASTASFAHGANDLSKYVYTPSKHDSY